MLETAEVSPWAWLKTLVPCLRTIPKRCATCNSDLIPKERGEPTLEWCDGFDWVLCEDRRHLCFDCADIEARKRKEERPNEFVFSWRVMRAMRW